MYDARGIAIIVIEGAKEKGKEISNLQLQKILYYIQKRFLKEYNTCCFKNSIFAWKHGPVVRDVYDLYREFGGEKIPSPRKGTMQIIAVLEGERFRPDYKEIIFEEKNLSEQHKTLILEEAEKYYDYNPWELVALSHEETAWTETEQSEEITESKIRGTL